MACPAPTSRSSAGRSAVRTIRGTPAQEASVTGGRRLAAAVPDVHVTAAGRPDALAAPRAKNPAQRSSTWEKQEISGWRANESTSGVLRDPGEVQAWLRPHRASSSQKAR